MLSVAPDGSPVEVYLRLPAGEAPRLIHEAIPSGVDVLDLGCGVGRLGRALARLGHPVSGVDESPAMLAHAGEIETIRSRIEELELERRFGVVLLASHFVNVPDDDRRRGLLEVCRRHMSDDGVVVVERYPPGWTASATPGVERRGEVEVELHDLRRRGDVMAAAVTYRLGSRSWTQRFSAVDVTDSRLAASASAAGLELVRCLDEERTWVLLAPIA